MQCLSNLEIQFQSSFCARKESHIFMLIIFLQNFFLSRISTMPKQSSKACLSFFIVLSLLANYGISEDLSEQSIAPAALLEPETKSLSPESFPLLSNRESPTIEAEADTLPPTYLSVPPSSDSIPEVETTGNETISQEDISTTSNANEPPVEAIGEENLSQKPASPPYVSDPTLGTNNGYEYNNISTASLSPSNVDSSVLDTRDMDNLSQENTLLPPSPSLDVPAVETKEENGVLSQENTTSALSSYSPNVDTPAPAYVERSPDVEASDDGSFTQENQSPATTNNAPAPETNSREEDFTTQYYSPASPSNTESQNPEIVPETNEYSSLPKSEAAPAPTQAAVSIPESDPTYEMTPPNDETFGLTPTTSDQTIFPSNYRAEDEPVEPYEEEVESWNGVNGAVAGVLVGACVIGVGGVIYQKRKNDNIRAQYTSLAKKEGV